MSPDYRIISIGTLDVHPLWDERVEVRTGHVTTTLITAGEAKILVNPSLPVAALVARMCERTSVKPRQITHVFLTSFARDGRRALEAFSGAEWLIWEPERAVAASALESGLHEAKEASETDLADHYEQELGLLGRCQTAPDHLTPGVDLFPLPGVTPGTCGLLLPLPRTTVLICGDAVATIEHLEQGKVLPHCHDIEQAQGSFAEAVEIADLLILGRDNIAPNPLRM